MSDAAAASDDPGIDAILDRFEGALLRYAQRITGDWQQAQDVVQETFVGLVREGEWLFDKQEEPGGECSPEGQRPPDARLAAWLFTVCRRKALDVRRKGKHMQAWNEAVAERCISREPAHDTAIEQQDAAGDIFRRLAALPENQQEVIRLKFQHGLSYKEISVVTNLTVTNVGYLLHTALSALRRQLVETTTATSTE